MIRKQKKQYGVVTAAVTTIGAAVILFLTGCDENAAPYQPAADPGAASPDQSALSFPGEIDDATLDKAAEAYVAVGQIETELQTKLEQTADPQLARQFSEVSQQEKLSAIEGAGIDQRTYQEVIQVVNRDEALRSKFVNKINALEQ